MNVKIHIQIHGVKEFVCLLQTLTPIILGLPEQNGLKFFLQHLWQNERSQKFVFLQNFAANFLLFFSFLPLKTSKYTTSVFLFFLPPNGALLHLFGTKTI